MPKDQHDITINHLSDYITEKGENWYRVIGSDGDQIEFLMTNLQLPRISLGDTLRVTVEHISNNNENGDDK